MWTIDNIIENHNNYYNDDEQSFYLDGHIVYDVYGDEDEVCTKNVSLSFDTLKEAIAYIENHDYRNEFTTSNDCWAVIINNTGQNVWTSKFSSW